MRATISEFAAAKINLALHVIGRRPDGYHELDSLVAFADVGDELLFTPAAEFSIVASGPFASDLPAPEDNLIFAAWKAMGDLAKSRGFHLPPVHVALTKNLPVAAGIGGGSANAAAAIRGFMRLAGIAGLDADIREAALTLGADVPVCLISKACRLQGVGERITPLENFTPLHAVLVNPRTAVSTAAVFHKLGLAKGEDYGTAVSPSPLWGGVGVGVAPANTAFIAWRNDLTPAAISLAPMIGEVIETLNHLVFSHARGMGEGAQRADEGRDARHRGVSSHSASAPTPHHTSDRLAAQDSPHPASGHLLPFAQVRTGEGPHPSWPTARMSGSGATCFGVFENAEAALEATRTLTASHPHYWTRKVMLS